MLRQLGSICATLVAEPYYDDTDAVSYCLQRFRTYEPSSGTYVGHDGYRHPCP